MLNADPLSDVLAMLKPQAYAFRGLDVGGKWSLHLPAHDDVVRCYAVHAGACSIWLEGEEAGIDLAAGDFVLLPHGQELIMGSDRNAPPIDLERFFATAEGRTAVMQGGGVCSGLGGYFKLSGSAAMSLLAALPPVVRLEATGDGAVLPWLIERMMRELRDPRPGGRLIAEHLSQTMLVEALRQHVVSEARQEKGWFAALADPQIVRALNAIHAEPGRRWTLAGLAHVSALSRSAFARRFTTICGEPAIVYLARWRILLAADRLSNGVPIAKVARDLGYGSESAFGAAFRRITGTSPGRYRTSSRHEIKGDA